MFFVMILVAGLVVLSKGSVIAPLSADIVWPDLGFPFASGRLGGSTAINSSPISGDPLPFASPETAPQPHRAIGARRLQINRDRFGEIRSVS